MQMKHHRSLFELFQVKGVVAYLFLYIILCSDLPLQTLFFYVTTAAICAVLNAHCFPFVLFLDYGNMENDNFIISNVLVPTIFQPL